ncbi:MAG: hypothetical protein AB7F98_13255 [Novosphingobium sp.]
MSEAKNSWSYINTGPEPVLVWLEPWAEEIDVPLGSTILIRSENGSALGEVERAEEHFTVWATANKVEVLIDGLLQDTASSKIGVLGGPSKEMLTVMYGGHPEARLGGAPANTRDRFSFWQWARSLLRIQG